MESAQPLLKDAKVIHEPGLLVREGGALVHSVQRHLIKRSVLSHLPSVADPDLIGLIRIRNLLGPDSGSTLKHL
jgi:hypothetical protein